MHRHQIRGGLPGGSAVRGRLHGECGARERTHEVELLALLVGVDGRALVVRHELLQRRELALPDAVERALHVHAEVLVPTGRLQRH